MLIYELALASQSWWDVVLAVRAQEAESYEHRRYPFAAMQRELQRGLLFDVGFNYLDYAGESFTGPHAPRRANLLGDGEMLDVVEWTPTDLGALVTFYRDPLGGKYGVSFEDNLGAGSDFAEWYVGAAEGGLRCLIDENSHVGPLEFIEQRRFDRGTRAIAAFS
jgi:hypothetical protein